VGGVGIFYGHLVYFVVIWYILLLFFGVFFPLWYFVLRKIWQPWVVASTSGKKKMSAKLERLITFDLVRGYALTKTKQKLDRVTRIFLVQHTKMGKNIPMDPKHTNGPKNIHQLTTKYTN
jgi:hypothetical protein